MGRPSKLFFLLLYLIIKILENNSFVDNLLNYFWLIFSIPFKNKESQVYFQYVELTKRS